MQYALTDKLLNPPRGGGKSKKESGLARRTSGVPLNLLEMTAADLID
jgi:hypothetical protein